MLTVGIAVLWVKIDLKQTLLVSSLQGHSWAGKEKRKNFWIERFSKLLT